RLLPASHRVRLGEHQPRGHPTAVLVIAGRQHPRSDHRADHLCEACMSTVTETETRTPEELPGVVTRLFKGVVYAEADEKIWQSLLTLASHVRDYVAVIRLDLILDESEGYAFLKSREDPDGTLPRLIPRRQLTFDVSLLL